MTKDDKNMRSLGQLQSSASPSSPYPQSDYGEFPSFGALEEENEIISTDNNMEATPALSKAQNTSESLPVELNNDNANMLPPSNPLNPVNPRITSEEYNKQLLSDARMRQSSVVNPDFIQQYYRESRLHHLSTWKAELKAQLQAAAREKTQSREPRKKPVSGSRRYILHVDFDSFFAAVSLLERPDLQNKPVAIAHGAGPGSEIASCNYVARGHGVKNGMWMKSALEACPELQVLSYDFPAYEEASRKFYNAVLAVDGIVQSVSIDEALIDITHICLDAGGSNGRDVSEESILREQTKADEIGHILRNEIKEITECAVSVGIGGNILLARVALRKAKPAGQFQLTPDAVLDFIGDLSVRDLPGVGYSLAGKLEELGVQLVKEMREVSRDRLISFLGPKTGIRMAEYARGIDKSEVGNDIVRKSVSAEVNWGIRFINQDQAEDFMRSLCEELNRRLVESMVRGKQLTLKVMRRSLDAPLEPVKHLGHGKCDVFNKSVMIGVATNSTDVLGKEAVSMLRSFNFSPGDLRGLGVQMTKLEPVKSNSSANLDSSQRKLNFTKSPSRKRTIEKLEQPRKGDSTPTQVNLMLSNSSNKALHISGSQLILPSQVDPSVLAELPEYIRARLVAQAMPQQHSPPGSPCPPSRSVAQSTALNLPPQSQLDPEILASLPDDVRNEVLGYYNQQPVAITATQKVSRAHPTSSGSLTLKKTSSPPKKRRGRPPKVSQAEIDKNLTQTSIIAPRTVAVKQEPVPEQLSLAQETAEISAEFLAELPEDIRQEILEQQERSRMLRSISAPAPESVSEPASELMEIPDSVLMPPPPIPKSLPLPPLAARPVFTSQGLSKLSDLRGAIGEWYSTFVTEGPYDEDVKVLCSYLRRVIADERDIDKAVSTVRWLMWLINDSTQQWSARRQSAQSQNELISWPEAVAIIHRNIQDAMEERGLPPVDLE
ncbi:DNA repair protein Rev1 [Penicillium taxi]|uniref:DNA repair protein Rev1 n=1 Tax=Penicillium taxi TaxID=168475 RepID=UPI00254530EB|nr:DNA repair protein Rev1 [Penicillium taxi]KAJ5902896.1 DNA repair protein Rev1 [Penicillium taxi]